jgi:hypothetical protein
MGIADGIHHPECETHSEECTRRAVWIELIFRNWYLLSAFSHPFRLYPFEDGSALRCSSSKNLTSSPSKDKTSTADMHWTSHIRSIVSILLEGDSVH